MIAWLVACGPGPDGLYGTKPLEALPAPEFAATVDAELSVVEQEA